MPVSARRSSISNRRNSQVNKPYRGDQLQVGKKTGYAVRHVQPESDGFEPFDDLIGQADKYTPPHVKNKRKKRAPATPLPEEDPEDDDELGEQSMDVDSPVKYMQHARQISVLSGASRVGSTSRPVRRSSAIDFDELPSPRTNITARTPVSSAGSSRLFKSFSMPESTSYNTAHSDQGGMNGDEQEPPSSPRSFVQINEDFDDDVPEFNIPEPSPPVQITPPRRGKERAQPPPPSPPINNGIEDEIAQELQDIDENAMEDGAEGDNARGDPPPKPEKPKPKPRKPREKPKAVQVASDDENANPDGLRRSKRHRYEPLDWWRCEKVVYGRRQHGLTVVPQIKEIIRIPKEPAKPLSKKKRGTTRARSKTRAVSEALVVKNPEEGWDEGTPQLGVVLDYTTNEEVERRVGFTAKHFTPKAAAGNEWFFQKIFGDGDFVAAGQLTIPVGKRKPSKATRDNTYIFFVHEGAVNVKVHNQSMIFATGAMFMIPRGNTYFIENIAQREAKLVFTQARKIPEGEDFTPGPDDRHSRRRSTSGRASVPEAGSEEEEEGEEQGEEGQEEEEEEAEEEPEPQPKKKKKTGR